MALHELLHVFQTEVVLLIVLGVFELAVAQILSQRPAAHHQDVHHIVGVHIFIGQLFGRVLKTQQLS